MRIPSPASLIFLLLVAGVATSCESEIPTPDAVHRYADEIDLLIPRDAALETLATGFTWSEGPLWVADRSMLLFSDVPNNRVYRWTDGDSTSVFLDPSGATGVRGSDSSSGNSGANGLALLNDGRLLLAQHGDRRIASLRLEQTAPQTFDTVVDNFEGKRFNSPNDLAVSSSGAIYFTDPPYGLADQDTSALKEMKWNGVYRLSPDGDVFLEVDSLSRPNGIALSPDETTLYVSNSEEGNEMIYRYDIAEGDHLANGRVFFDARGIAASGLPGLPDGMAVAVAGNVFATGPGGVLVLSPEGLHLGTIRTETASANCAFGGADGTELFITAGSRLLRIRTLTRGNGFASPASK